jgi:hypothetical protein
MKHLSGMKVLMGVMFASASLVAQTTTPAFVSAFSTGMVGLAASQTAQLNVVNLSPTPTTASTAACEVQIELWDSSGKLVKSKLIANLAPGAADSLQIRLTDVTAPTSPLRTEVRAVMRYNPFTAVPTSGSTSPVIPIAYVPNCTPMLTLEMFDTATGVTQSVTSDTRALQTIGIVPLITTPARMQ